MTVHVLSGLRVIRDTNQAGDPAIEVESLDLHIGVADATTTFSYTVTTPVPNDMPEVDVTFANEIFTALSSVSFDEMDTWPDIQSSSTSLGQVNWGAGKVTQVLVIDITWDDGEEDMVVMQLGGDALPFISSVAEWNAFEANVASASAITTGPFAPGANIPFAGLPNHVTLTDNQVNGTSGDNTLNGTAGNDVILAGANDGEDVINGSAGNDYLIFSDSQAGDFYTIDYSGLAGPIAVDVDQDFDIAEVDKGASGTDQLIDLFRAMNWNTGDGVWFEGTGSNDTFDLWTESSTWVGLRGGGGNDTFNIGGEAGEEGIVRLSYSNAVAGINANLVSGVITDGGGGTDQLNVDASSDTRIEIQGSDFTDTILGSSRDERFILGEGNDTLDAGGGNDVLRYDRSGVGAVNVDLDAGSATGTWNGNAFTHTISNVEQVWGSRSDNDVITGDSNDNWFRGRGGNDTLNGAGGDDTLVGEDGNDVMDGGNGNDVAEFWGVNRADATITFGSAGEATVVSSLGTDLVQRVETLRFDDQDVALGSAPPVTTTTPVSDIHTFSALAVVRDPTQPGEPVIEVEDVEFRLAVPATSTTFSYSVLNAPTGELPEVDLSSNELFTAINAITMDALADFGDTITAYLGEVSWNDGTAKTTQVLIIQVEDSEEDAEIIMQLGGDAFPTINSIADWNAFDLIINGAAAIATGPFAPGTDITITSLPNRTTQFSVNPVDGTSGDDTLNGTAGDDLFYGQGGEDLFIGTAGNDTMVLSGTQQGDGAGFDYSGLAGPIDVDFDGDWSIFEVDKGASGLDTLVDLHRAADWNTGDGVWVIGTSSADTFNIVMEEDTWTGLAGGGGNDTFEIGGDAYNTGTIRLMYSSAAAGINANLVSGVIADGDGGTDQLNFGVGSGHLMEIEGSNFTDTILGSDRDERFILREGNDTLDAGGGIDLLRYDRSGVGAVNVNLATGVATGTWNGNAFTHTISNVEQVRGSRNDDDVITGDGNDNWFGGGGGDDTLIGGGGSDTLVGGGGNDSLDGGGGDDVAEFSMNRADAVITTGAAGQATIVSSEGTDVVENVEALRFWDQDVVLDSGGPTAGDDSLTGTSGDDTIDGLAGDDTIDGQGGNDSLLGGDGNDNLLGGEGNDYLNPGENNEGWDYVQPGTGNDTVDMGQIVLGGVGIGHGDLNAGITATINGATNSGTIDKGANGTTTLVDVENPLNWWGFGVDGTGYDDTFNATLSGSGSQWLGLSGFGGNNTFNILGGSGLVRLDYASASSAINANLSTGGIQNGQGGNDTVTGGGSGPMIELRASDFADTILGGAGDERFILREGNDTLDGGGGNDLLRYDRSGVGAVTVDLDSGIAMGTWNGNAFVHSISNVEAVRGSRDGGDALAGDGNNNLLEGRGGDDSLSGDGGNDTLDGGDGQDTLVGGSGKDTLLGGDGNDTLNGSNGADSLEGGEGNDRLRGGDDGATADVDILRGGAGNDRITSDQTDTPNVGFQDRGDQLFGDEGNDTLIGGLANDWIEGGTGDDKIDGGGGDDYIETGTLGIVANGQDTASGGDGNDSIMGSNSRDFLNGDAGDDTLNGGDDGSSADIDVLYGGSGNDSLVSGQVDTPSAGFEDRGDQLFGEADNDTLIGGLANDWLEGGTGNDSINGGGGDDHIETGTLGKGALGQDIASGGDGNDSIMGSNGKDTLMGDAGDDTLNGGNDGSTADVDMLYGGSGDDLLVSGQVVTPREGFQRRGDQLFGEADDDTLIGGLADDLLVGGAGRDTIEGGGGDDEILTGEVGDNSYQTNYADGQAGNDDITGANGKDTLLGGEGNDTLNGGNDASSADIDILFGGGGDDLLISGQVVRPDAQYQTRGDQLFGEAGNDKLVGGYADDLLEGGSGNDLIKGGGGNDVIYTASAGQSSAGSNTAYGQGGHDSITGSNGKDTLYGNSGNDTLNGGDDWVSADIDFLFGGTGDDLLISGQEDAPGAGFEGRGDVLHGEEGDDILVGGLAADEFHFRVGWENDRVDQFQDDIDEIILTGFGFANTAEAMALATQDGTSVVFDFGGGDILTVTNTTILALEDDIGLG